MGASIIKVLVAVVLATVVCAQPLFRNCSLPFEAASEVRMQLPRRHDALLCFGGASIMLAARGATLDKRAGYTNPKELEEQGPGY